MILVSQNIKASLQELTIHRRQARLNKLVEGLELGEIYGAMIELIKARVGVN